MSSCPPFSVFSVLKIAYSGGVGFDRMYLMAALVPLSGVAWLFVSAFRSMASIARRRGRLIQSSLCSSAASPVAWQCQARATVGYGDNWCLPVLWNDTMVRPRVVDANRWRREHGYAARRFRG